MKKIPVCLRCPDQVMFVYGTKKIKVSIDPKEFEQYVFMVDEEKLNEVEDLLVNPTAE